MQEGSAPRRDEAGVDSRRVAPVAAAVAFVTLATALALGLDRALPMDPIPNRPDGSSGVDVATSASSSAPAMGHPRDDGAGIPAPSKDEVARAAAWVRGLQAKTFAPIRAETPPPLTELPSPFPLEDETAPAPADPSTETPPEIESEDLTEEAPPPPDASGLPAEDGQEGRDPEAPRSLTDPEGTTTIHLTLSGMNPAEQYILFALYDRAEGFPTECSGSNVVQWGRVAVTDYRMTVVLRAVEPGRYAIAAFHDQNNNLAIDRRRLGIPTEPWGVSNNVRGRMGPPSFDAAAFYVDEQGLSMSIHLQR